MHDAAPRCYSRSPFPAEPAVARSARARSRSRLTLLRTPSPSYQLLAQIKLSSSGSDIPSGIEFKVASALPAPISAVGAGRDAQELTGNAYRNSFYWNARDKTLCVAFCLFILFSCCFICPRCWSGRARALRLFLSP